MDCRSSLTFSSATCAWSARALTGWAQVKPLRGDTSIARRIQYDLYYLRHWSIGFDPQIILLTVFSGMVNKNAH
jgi:lipopolysaccharide/colanic/teichoic acid biosynthesis glycosyltransferase